MIPFVHNIHHQYTKKKKTNITNTKKIEMQKRKSKLTKPKTPKVLKFQWLMTENMERS